MKPIDLYYWPTPNGWKISIMLEECGLPYETHLIDIGKGDQFKPEFLAVSPNNKIPHRGLRNRRWRADLGLRERSDPAISRTQDGKFYPVKSASAWRSISGCSGRWAASAHGRADPSFPHLRAGEDRIRHQPLHQRNKAPIRCVEQAAEGSRIPRGRVFHRRYRLLRLGEAVGAAGAGHHRVPAYEALARHHCRPPAVQRGLAVGAEKRDPRASACRTRRFRKSCSATSRRGEIATSWPDLFRPSTDSSAFRQFDLSIHAGPVD